MKRRKKNKNVKGGVKERRGEVGEGGRGREKVERGDAVEPCESMVIGMLTRWRCLPVPCFVCLLASSYFLILGLLLKLGVSYCFVSLLV